MTTTTPPRVRPSDAAARVAAALARDALEQALELALAAWRETPSAAIADAIDRLDGLARERFAGPKGRTKEAFQTEWMRWADDDASELATGWLAATLTSKLPILPGWNETKKYGALLDRLKALEQRPADPRIAVAAVALVDAGKYSIISWNPPNNNGVYGRCLSLIVATGDTRQTAVLKRVKDQPRSKLSNVRAYLASRLKNTLKQLGPPSAPDATESEAWDAIAPVEVEPLRPVDPEQLAQFLAAIRAEPEVDDLRLVYADLLQEAGDPRGRFIALQVAASRGTSTKKVQKTARKLLREHKRQWLGEALAATLTRVEFERGFLASASLARHAAAVEKVWKLAAKDERLLTLHTLKKSSGNLRNYRAFVHTARNLRCLDVPNGVFLEAIAKLPGRDFRTLSLSRQPNRKRLQLMAQGACFERLESLELTVLHGGEERLLGDLDKTGLLDRLTTLSLEEENWWVGTLPSAFALRCWPQLPDTLRSFAQRGSEINVTIQRTADGCAIDVDLLSVQGPVDADLVEAVPREATTLRLRNHGGGSITPLRKALSKRWPDLTLVD